jgi:hypothetical protein
LARILRLYLPAAAAIFLLAGVGQYVKLPGIVRVLLVAAAGVAIVESLALLLLAWVVLALLNDVALDTSMDGGYLLCLVSIVLAFVGCLLIVIGRRRHTD